MVSPKPRRISREEAILELQRYAALFLLDGSYRKLAINYAIRALKREQKAADAKRKEKADGA